MIFNWFKAKPKTNHFMIKKKLKSKTFSFKIEKTIHIIKVKN